MFSSADGIATRKIKNARPAPSVLATSRCDTRTLEMPELVSIVIGNHTASAISAAPEVKPVGKSIIDRGIHAVAGIGPSTFSTGMPQ